MIPSPPTPFEPRLVFVGLFALAAATAAIVVDLSDTHAGHHADSFIPVLASLYAWEPYFWESDRNGQLLPLLASPWVHPFTNLLVQFGVSVFAGVVALGVFARLLAPKCWPAVAAGAWALFLFGFNEYIRFNMFNPCQPYAASMLCAGVGLWAAFGPVRSWRRWVLATGMFAVAGWVNIGLGMNLGPWLLFGWVLTGRGETTAARRTDYLRGIGLVFVGTAVGMGLNRLSPYPVTQFTLLPWEQWMTGWEGVGRDLSRHFGTNLELSVGLLAFGLVWLLVPVTRSVAVRRMKNGIAALAALAASFAFVGTTDWAASNGYTSRYLFPSLMLLNVAAVGAALGPPLEILRPTYQRCLGFVAVFLVAVLPLTVYGWPSVREARASLDQHAEGYTDEVLAHRCTHVSGEYWDVWPTVFGANLALAERGETQVVWGITTRCEPTRSRWSAVSPSEVRLGWLVREGQAEPPPGTDGVWRHSFPNHRRAEQAPKLWLYIAPE